MDNRKKRLLQDHQKAIVQDLDPNYIVDDLYTNNAISNDDLERIFTITDRANRTRFLLSLIQNGNNHTFQVFVDSLAKDYGWLYEKFSTANMKESIINESFEDSLSIGDVPRLPEHYVQRTHLEADVATKLKALERHKLLVLHGMSGCGKSCVVIGTLRHYSDLVTNNFGGVVFWLNFSNVKTEDDIIAQQIKLYRKTSQYRRRDNNYMNLSISMSSIGSNTDSQSLSSNEWSTQDLRDALNTTFQEERLQGALLVLDEVNEKKFVEAFDIGCKLLITTRDTDVVSNLEPKTIIKVDNNFKELESLQLFASCLDVNTSQLPRQAKRLHEICKGSPFHIALIGAELAENKERLLHDTSRWDYYIKKLVKKKDIMSMLMPQKSDYCDPMKPIEICINSLQPDILLLFKMLAVLPDNVKVSTKVLSVLWMKRNSEVESIMKRLRSKSLVNEFYVQELANYHYEIHDLIMNYLRSKFTQEQMNKLHVDLLTSYGYSDVNDLPVELANDGYIAFYIGYHLNHTQVADKQSYFNKLYLNLKFLGNKVRLTGPADVIMDFHKYGQFICRDKIDEELSRNIVEYLSTYGHDLYRYPHTDIVQNILQYVSKGALYQRAYEVAQRDCAKNQLYFDFLHEQNVDEVEEIKHSTIDVKQSIKTVCFLHDYILVGTENGVVKIFHVHTNKLKKELQCNSAYPLKCVTACPINAIKVAALTTEGVLHLWYLDDLYIDPEYSDHTIEEENEKNGSENEGSEYEHNITTYEHNVVEPKLGAFLNFSWANNEEKIIMHTSKMIIIYGNDCKPMDLLDIFDRDINIICCIFSNDDKNVIMGYCLNSTYYIDIIELTRKEKLVSFKENDPIINVLCVPGTIDKILVINETHVRAYSYSYPYSKKYNSEKIITSKDVKENVKFISAVVNKSGTLLFVSTDDSRVICVDLKSNSYVYDLDNRRGNVVSMAVSEVLYDEFLPGSDVLLSGTGTVENSVKVWYLDNLQATQKNRKVRLTAKFDVSFLNMASPKTSVGVETPPSEHSAATPKRHQSFVTHKDVEKKSAKKTMSLDRHSLKPLNLKGISNGNEDCGIQPLLVVVDDKNNIQVMRGRKIFTMITAAIDQEITAVRISPCNQYIIYGLRSGTVKKFTLRSREVKIIMDINSPIHYLNFINPNILIVSGKNRCLMAYKYDFEGEWKLEMLQKGNCCLGSQEILNDIIGKKKNNQSESSGSETSTSSKERLFPCLEGKSRFYKGSSLVQCFWVEGVGMLTVENNATIKLWNQDFKLITVLNGRQTDVYINCAAFHRNVLAVCDDYGKFQTFELIEDINERITLQTIQEFKLNNKIVSCDLTNDGHILAMGLDSGSVVVWNVKAKYQLAFLKHHKTQVQHCVFSPMPSRLYRSNSTAQSPGVSAGVHSDGAEDDSPPLVLVTMASEIVWWNVSYIIKNKRNSNKPNLRARGRNVLTPLTSPVESRTELTHDMDSLNLNNINNHFFGNGYINMSDSWEGLWRHKTYKDGSRKKEVLACIKLSGMNAKRLSIDDKFSCFVTVDNPGHIHIMNVMRSNPSP